mgnify:CR=1 FL=1
MAIVAEVNLLWALLFFIILTEVVILNYCTLLLKMAKSKEYSPPKVSRWYRFDWQYAADISKVTSLQTASFIIVVVPLALQFRLDLPANLWLMWLSAVFFVLSLVIMNLWGPKFVREYRDYGQYSSRNHSHRWIVWEFYNNVTLLSGWKTIIEETLHKGISFYADTQLAYCEYKCAPLFAHSDSTNELQLHYPENVDRDIYLPISFYGKRVILMLQEDDPKLKEKEKELFWILYSQAAKEKEVARKFYWASIYISIFLSFSTIIHNVIKVLPTIWSYISTSPQ